MFLGEAIRMSRLFQDGNVVVVAVDHGGQYGPIQGLEDFTSAVENFKDADAILMNNGMLRRVVPATVTNGEIWVEGKMPKLICRLNWSTNYVYIWDYDSGRNRQVISVEDAVALGTDFVLASLFLHNGDEAIDIENMDLFGKMVSQKRRLGIPLCGEIYPSHTGINAEEFHDVVQIACRIVSEQGADFIKTFYTGPKFHETVKTTPIPILALGADKTDTEVEALQRAYDAVQAGARGVVFGRNVIHAKDPARFLAGLKRVVKKGQEPTRVAKELELDA